MKTKVLAAVSVVLGVLFSYYVFMGNITYGFDTLVSFLDYLGMD